MVKLVYFKSQYGGLDLVFESSLGVALFFQALRFFQALLKMMGRTVSNPAFNAASAIGFERLLSKGSCLSLSAGAPSRIHDQSGL